MAPLQTSLPLQAVEEDCLAHPSEPWGAPALVWGAPSSGQQCLISGPWGSAPAEAAAWGSVSPETAISTQHATPDDFLSQGHGPCVPYTVKQKHATRQHKSLLV